MRPVLFVQYPRYMVGVAVGAAAAEHQRGRYPGPDRRPGRGVAGESDRDDPGRSRTALARDGSGCGLATLEPFGQRVPDIGDVVNGVPFEAGPRWPTLWP